VALMEFTEALAVLIDAHTKSVTGSDEVLVELGAIPDAGEQLGRYIEAWIALRKHLGMRTGNVATFVSSRAPAIIARKDEIVTCEDGHPVCVIAYDHIAGASINGKMFKAWRDGIEPVVQPDGSVLCMVCGAPWLKVKKFDQGVKFACMHFANGWR
jgi:hypothetical protein